MFPRKRVSHYQLVKILGKGGFATTYLAKDLNSPEKAQCAIKRINPNIQDEKLLEVVRRLFNTEAEVLYKVGEHDRIPSLLAYFEDNKRFYLVQEFIEGETLSKEFVVGKIWNESDTIELLKDCLSILKYIHAQGVIHRDIKPSNLIRRKPDGKLILIDFGSVKQIISQTQIFSTIVIGTKGYIAPEQALGKPRFNSDIYSLGTIAIQALTGVKPKEFKKDSNSEIIWSDLNKNLNPKLIKIIKKMTRFNVENRYQYAGKVLEDLNGLDKELFSSPFKQYFELSSLGKNFKNGSLTKKSKIKIIVIILILILGLLVIVEHNERNKQNQQKDNSIESLYLN